MKNLINLFILFFTIYLVGCAPANKYVGEKKNGIPDGKGKLTTPNGTIFEGVFRKGNLVSTKYSVISYPNGSKIKAKVLGLKVASNDGVISHPNGWKYEGYLKKGLPELQGTFYHSNGWKYEGNWRNGCSHSEGIYSKDGSTYNGFTYISIEYNINDENYGYSAELTQKIKKKCEIKKHQGPMKKNPPNKKSEPAAPRVISEPATPKVIIIPSPKN